MPATMPGAIPCSSANPRTADLPRGDVATKRSHSARVDESVSGPLVGFRLDAGLVLVLAVHENASLAVKQNMRGLVEEAEPEMIVRFVARTQLDDRLSRATATTRTAERRPGKRLDRYQRDARPIAEPLRARQSLADGIPRQTPDLPRRAPEAAFVIVGARLTVRLGLAETKPCRQGGLVALEAGRMPIGHVRQTVPRGPGLDRADAKERQQRGHRVRIRLRRLEAPADDELTDGKPSPTRRMPWPPPPRPPGPRRNRYADSMPSQISASTPSTFSNWRAVRGSRGALPAMISLIGFGERPHRRANSACEMPCASRRSSRTHPAVRHSRRIPVCRRHAPLLRR